MIKIVNPSMKRCDTPIKDAKLRLNRMSLCKYSYDTALEILSSLDAGKNVSVDLGDGSIGIIAGVIHNRFGNAFSFVGTTGDTPFFWEVSEELFVDYLSGDENHIIGVCHEYLERRIFIAIYKDKPSKIVEHQTDAEAIDYITIKYHCNDRYPTYLYAESKNRWQEEVDNSNGTPAKLFRRK